MTKIAKDLKGKELGVGIRQRKDGRYEARAVINGITINLYNLNLKHLKKDFQSAKEQAKLSVDLKWGNITLDEWFEEWFKNYKEPMIKTTSIYPMKSRFYNTFGKQIGKMKVRDIRNIDIQNVINVMKMEGRASSSMRDALGRIRECLEMAKNNKIISQNPCFGITVPWEKKQIKRRFLTVEEQNIFLKAVESNWYKEMFYTMFLTGMRIGEIGGLKWCDVDFENKCIHIRQSLSCNYEKGIKKLLLTTPKTFNSYRTIPFMGETEEILLFQKEKQRQLRKKLGQRYRNTGEFSDLVFVTSMGSPVSRYHAEKECRKVVDVINEMEAVNSVKEKREPIVFERVYPHAIRHTFCSRCFENDMNPKVVQNLMGHQHYSTTIEIYTHVSESRLENEIAKFGSAVSKSSI